MTYYRFITGALALAGVVCLVGAAPAQSPKAAQRPTASASASDEKIAGLEKRIEEQEEQLHARNRGQAFAGFTELGGERGKADPAEIGILRELAVARLTTWRAAAVRARTGVSSPADEALAGVRLFMTLAQLAWLEGNDNEAMKNLRGAVDASDHLVAEVQRTYAAGTLTIEQVESALTAQAEVRLAFRRAGGKPLVADAGKRPWKLPEGLMPEAYPPEATARVPRPAVR